MPSGRATRPNGGGIGVAGVSRGAGYVLQTGKFSGGIGVGEGVEVKVGEGERVKRAGEGKAGVAAEGSAAHAPKISATPR